MSEKAFSAEWLRLDCAREADRIGTLLREGVIGRFKKKGLVVALSGGIDSSVVGALAVRALGSGRVFGLLLPERDSAPETLDLSRLIASHLGISSACEDITPVLDAFGCYRRRDEAVRAMIPEYGPGWRCKIVLPGVLDHDTLRFFSVVAQSPSGETRRERLSLEAYLGIVAATNFKQRTRKALEYYHADRLNYAVAGTPNRQEYDQGFFVKGGDGLADVKPIAHLYKLQVYEMAEFLGVPEEIRRRPPTTDTYSMPQSQEEFFFSVSYDRMDLILYGKDHGCAAAEVGAAAGLSAEQVERVYRDIEAKRRMARYLHAPPVVAERLTGPHDAGSAGGNRPSEPGN